ncbi:APC family permease [Corallococcus carmarthensis]|uniref:APC family permease n=1 Tax=Corallococcus carmarthensis TaxID=2316728 RepID=A0A3A8K6S3_9BACT|nr:APC family permease [Corallococcus carmarthensis]RKG99850.1 APC family permease [Corallococcus carmarthensis]
MPRSREGNGVADLLLGRPLTSAQAMQEKTGVLTGVALLGLDALSSAAYGPEAALTVLRPLGAGGLWLLFPITVAIVGLLMVVAGSYAQTIAAYPSGGGAYTVAKQNLGRGAGLLAATALMLDYLLNVAVGLSAGTGALVSALPALRPHTLPITLGLLALLTLVNLRGVSEAGAVFVVPTWFFITSLSVVLAVGLFKLATGDATPVQQPPPLAVPTASLGAWLVIRAFASGCTAMTGVEAISNAVPIFRDPSIRRARVTLGIIVGILVTMLLGIALLCRAYGVGATDPDGANYQTVLSQLIAAVMGRGVFYYVAMAAILCVLALSANTSYAGFPLVCQVLARERYLPPGFAHRGRRLALSRGILTLSGLAALLLIICKGITDRLIPLFAIGALMAFTLSQAGMVVHWSRHREEGWRWRRTLNGAGAVMTALTLVIVGVSKFMHGGWAAFVLVPMGLVVLSRVHAAYTRTRQATELKRPVRLTPPSPRVAVVPVDRWSHASETALRFALELSDDVRAVHICSGDTDEAALDSQWQHFVQGPLLEAGRAPPPLVHVGSPYRALVWPLVDYLDALLAEVPGRTVAIVMPELLERHWYRAMLYGRRSELLRSALLLSGERRLVVVSVPWYLRTEAHPEPHSAWAAPGHPEDG